MTPPTRGFYMTETIGIGIVNPGTVKVWPLTPEQSQAVADAATRAGMSVDAFLDQFEHLVDLLDAVSSEH
jgi:hypothetical protein